MHTIRNQQGSYIGDDEAFWTHLEGEETTLALFCKLTPSDIWASLPTLGFTSHTADVDLTATHGISFVSSAGLIPSASEIEGGKPSNVEMMSVFDDDNLSEADLLAGKWNNARYELWLMNWADTDMGEFVVASGIISDVKNYQQWFKAEVRGLSALLESNFGVLTSRSCRVNEFADDFCKKDPTGTVGGLHITKTLTVSSVTDTRHIVLTRVEAVPDDFYTNGKITGLTGNNEDISREILSASGFGTGYVNVTLRRPFPLVVAAGDTFSLVAGCNRTLDRCRYFENVVNFRGEPFIPSMENVLKQNPS